MATVGRDREDTSTETLQVEVRDIPEGDESILETPVTSVPLLTNCSTDGGGLIVYVVFSKAWGMPEVYTYIYSSVS